MKPLLSDRSPSKPQRMHVNDALIVTHVDSASERYNIVRLGEPNTVLKIRALVTLVELAKMLQMKVHRGTLFDLDAKRYNAWVSVTPLPDGYEIMVADICEAQECTSLSASDRISSASASTGWLLIGEDNRIWGGEIPAEIASSLQLDHYIGQFWPALLRPIHDADFPKKVANGRFPLWQTLDGEELCFWPVSKIAWQVHIVPAETDGGQFWYFHIVEDAKSSVSEGTHTSDYQPTTNSKHLFIHSVAPALRVPVERIMANARTISEQKDGPLRNHYTDYANDIAMAAEHLLALIDDASDLEAVDDDSFVYIREAVDICDVARRAAGLLSVKATARNVFIETPASHEILLCEAEFRRVLQIVLNLLGNAIRYGPEDSTVSLRAELLDGHAVLTISDQGESLSEADRAMLFNKFERLGRSGDGGSGLGLYIARKLARAMGGDVMIDNEQARGTHFMLKLPLLPISGEGLG